MNQAETNCMKFKEMYKNTVVWDLRGVHGWQCKRRTISSHQTSIDKICKNVTFSETFVVVHSIQTIATINLMSCKLPSSQFQADRGSILYNRNIFLFLLYKSPDLKVNTGRTGKAEVITSKEFRHSIIHHLVMQFHCRKIA